MSNETNNPLRRIHPLVAVAAVAITGLSLTGIAAMTGHLGNSHADPTMPTRAQAANPVSAQIAVPVTAPVTAPVIAPAATSTAAPVTGIMAANTNDVAPKTERAPVQPAPKVNRPAAAAPSPAKEHPSTARAAIDPSMGVVLAINRVEVASPNSGIGAVVGGVVGGVAGHQVGGGHGKDAMTVLGAVGGAVAGNAIEKHERRVYRYDVQVRSEDGTTRTLHYSSPPSFVVGERISLKAAG